MHFSKSNSFRFQDGNFKVRELAHVTLGAFAQKLTRQIAGQLKSVVPYWLMGEHDPYQVAAQAAKQTFQDAFPAGKRAQVLTFCKEAIVTVSLSLILSYFLISLFCISAMLIVRSRVRRIEWSGFFKVSDMTFWKPFMVISFLYSVDTTEESQETRSIRLASCSLWALHALASTITVDDLTSAQDSFQQALFSSPKFMKMCDKAKPLPVSAFFSHFVL